MEREVISLYAKPKVGIVRHNYKSNPERDRLQEVSYYRSLFILFLQLRLCTSCIISLSDNP